MSDNKLKLPEMTYEKWRENSAVLLAEADKYNEWREEMQMRLLTDIAPRIGKLSKVLYMGCGFHYAMEQELGHLIRKLSLPIQWNGNWYAKIPSDQLEMIVTEVMAEQLIEKVEEAEKSAKEKV